MFGYGPFITNYVGASIRWTWGQIRLKFFGGPKFSFEEYLNGPKNAEGIIDSAGHGCVNQVVAFVVIIIIIALSVKLINS